MYICIYIYKYIYICYFVFSLTCGSQAQVSIIQWPCRHVSQFRGTSTTYEAYVRAKDISHNIWPYMVLTYLHFGILRISFLLFC